MTKNEILIKLMKAPTTKFLKGDFALQSFPQKVFTSVWAIEAEVNNGGFSQYFFNTACETAAFVVEALDAIGAPKTADICRRAIRAGFPSGLPSTAEEISSAAAEFPEDTLKQLEALDREFFAYPHDLTALVYDYVVRHPEEFGVVPLDSQ
jgi:hypothetical protein